MILIQHIETWWLKSERGAQAGTLRGKTPVALPVPMEAIPDRATGAVLHQVVYRRTTPVPEMKLTLLPDGGAMVGCVRLMPNAEALNVLLEWTEYGGSPARWQTGLEKKNWSILEGQWCQIRYNGRITLERTWRYHITTVNVGAFEQPQSGAFLNGRPTFRREDLVRLL